MPGQHDDRGLEAVLAQHAHRLAAVDVGQADIHDHEVDLAVLGGIDALGAGLDRVGLELLVQAELLGERAAHVGVVVDDQNLAGNGHQRARSHHGAGQYAKLPQRSTHFVMSYARAARFVNGRRATLFLRIRGMRAWRREP